MVRRVLDENFFKKSTLEVAENLIGKFLVRKAGKIEIARMITETEAYDGPKDKASHASRGMTERNAIMFDQGGYFYVYLCYGMYSMLNVVTGKKDYPSAVLIRGVEGADGPGKLTKYLKIDRKFNKKKIEKKTGLWLEDRGVKIDKGKVRRTPRMGVDYAGSIWSKKLYRFVLTKS